MKVSPVFYAVFALIALVLAMYDLVELVVGRHPIFGLGVVVFGFFAYQNARLYRQLVRGRS